MSRIICQYQNEQARTHVDMIAIAVHMVIISLVMLCIVQMQMNVKSYSIKTEKQIMENDDTVSQEVISSFDDETLDSLIISDIEKQCNKELLAKLGSGVRVEVKNSIENGNNLQVKVNVESKRNPVVVIDNIELENEKFELSRKEKWDTCLIFRSAW